MTQSPDKITYLVGDAMSPTGEGKKIIAHICNDCKPGRWGAGFVLALSRRWVKPESEYRKWASSNDEDFELGSVQFVQVESDIVVANMIAQRGISFRNGPPIRHDALSVCLGRVTAVDALS